MCRLFDRTTRSITLTDAGRRLQPVAERVVGELRALGALLDGNEAAVHHRNCIVGTNQVIESIETYRFGPGSLHVRYFLKPPEDAAVNLEQFRGFAATPSQEAP